MLQSPNITDYVPSWHHVKDFGAIGDGNVDDQPAIRRAMLEASIEGGGLVVVPAGTYRLDNSISWGGLTNVCIWLSVGSSLTGVGTLPAATGLNNSIFDFRNGTPSGGVVSATYPLESDGLPNPTISLPAPNAITQTNTVTGTALIASGLTGAQAAGRYVGATTNGAPLTGTFVAGDWIVDQTGSFWVCTVDGSVGTWIQVAANQYPGPPVTGVSASTQLLSSGGTYPDISLDSTAAIVQTNEVGGTDIKITGLPGATAGTRLIGATASGAPTSGTYLKGDLNVDQSGSLWICTVAGTSPAAVWVQLAGNTIVGTPVTGVTANAPLTSTGGTTPVIALPTNGVITQTVPITGTALSASGLTGATAGGRFVGGTTNGAPVSGTYLKGDYIVDQTGSFWINTVAGSPGTWVQMAGNTIVGSPVTGVAGTNPIVSSGGTTPSLSWNAGYAINQTNTITGTALIPTGLGNATAATRYVGGTASVAPTSGTFLVGDYVVTQNAKIFVCITAGSPGTWSQITGAASTSGWKYIAKSTVTVSGTNLISFSSIPATYLDLMITGRTNTLASPPAVQFLTINATNSLGNGHTGSSYASSVQYLAVSNTTVTPTAQLQSGSGTLLRFVGALGAAEANVKRQIFQIHIPDYSTSNATHLIRANGYSYGGVGTLPIHYSWNAIGWMGTFATGGEIIANLSIGTTTANQWDVGSELTLWGLGA